ncbi:MAG: hypothetical protein FJ026_11830 [Chloroflexi bacterium]|nr:hypothetical protein [Chloroflexota bacterium]
MLRRTRRLRSLCLGLALVFVILLINLVLSRPIQVLSMHDASGMPSVGPTVSWGASSGCEPDACVSSRPQPAPAGPDDKVQVVIQLEGDPVSAYKLKLRASAAHLAQTEKDAIGAYEAALEQGRDSVLAQCKAQGIALEVRWQYSYVFNGLAVSVRQDDVARIAALPGVRQVHPDTEVHALLEDSVPLIGADQVWTMLDPSGQPVTGKGIRVAVLDTGIDYTHPDLGGGFGPGFKVAGGYDFVNDDPDPMDDRFHGTHCAGILAANGTVKGVAPEATLYAYKVLNAEGSGSGSDIMAGIERATNPDGDPTTDDAVDVISMSLGGSGNPDDPLAQAVDAAFAEGVVVVVAAGNEGSAYGSVQSPGVARKAFTVGASDKDDAIATFSSRGPVSDYLELVKPDILAPGVDIRSTYPGGGYAELRGTSMSTPHVAGCAALIKQLHPSWSPQMIQANLMNTARHLSLDVHTQGAGRVQVDDAAEAPAVLTPGSMSFGLVDSAEPLWTRSTTLSLSNVSATEQEFTLLVAGDLPAGVSTQLSPEQVTLAASETATIAFTITVDTAVTPDQEGGAGSYEGRVIVQSGSEGRSLQTTGGQLAMPFVFYKGSFLQITFDVPPSMVIVHNGQTQWKLGSPKPLTTFMLPEGIYDVWAGYDCIAWVIREDVAVSGPTAISIDRSEAVHRVTLAPRDRNGEPISSGYRTEVYKLTHLPSGQSTQWTVRFNYPLTRYFSDMSSDYVWEWRTDVVWQGSLYQFYERLAGVDSDVTLQNAPEDLWHIEQRCHPPPGCAQLRLNYYLPYG